MPGDHGIWKRAPIPKGIAKLREGVLANPSGDGPMVSPRIRVRLCEALFSGVIALLLAAGMAYRCHAQTVAVADVSGIVADQSGSAVPGATVRMVQTDKEFVRTAV